MKKKIEMASDLAEKVKMANDAILKIFADDDDYEIGLSKENEVIILYKGTPMEFKGFITTIFISITNRMIAEKNKNPNNFRASNYEKEQEKWDKKEDGAPVC